MGDVVVVAEQLRRRVPGGIGTYVRGLLQGLTEIGADVTLVASRAPARPDPLRALGFPVRASALPGPLLTRCWDLGVAVGGVRNAGVLHATSLATAYPRHVATAVMVHDLAWREVPEAYPARGRRWHEAALARCLRRAAVIITPSEASAVAFDGCRVEVIPEGCDHLPPPDRAGADALLARLGVVTPYLLSVSTLEPRKNLARLMQAYSRAVDRLPEPWPLIVAGAAGWGPELAPTPGVKLAGAVDSGVLAALYAGARCVAYVPLTEGWGLPPVEAMTACTPVVASPMPSTARAALEVDPRDIDAIADALVVAASDEGQRSALVTAGLLRAAELTWSAAARRHVEVWESLR
ncbi:MAG: glycosyltransferase family 4 protein [Acidimicrobiales bacterium]